MLQRMLGWVLNVLFFLSSGDDYLIPSLPFVYYYSVFDVGFQRLLTCFTPVQDIG